MMRDGNDPTMHDRTQYKKILIFIVIINKQQNAFSSFLFGESTVQYSVAHQLYSKIIIVTISTFYQVYNFVFVDQLFINLIPILLTTM